MIVKKILPNYEVGINSYDPLIQNVVIELFKDSGIEVYINTKRFDPEYPVLYWAGNQLSQTRELDKKVSLEEFLSLFFGEDVDRIQLTPHYEAVIDHKEKVVVVGCQNIPFAKVTELYNLINN